jgi:hypothetical protein
MDRPLEATLRDTWLEVVSLQFPLSSSSGRIGSMAAWMRSGRA